MKNAIGLTLLSALAFHGCGGGGGGGSDTRPVPRLESACFYGSSPSDTNPDAGEKVRLSFDSPVSLNTGAPLSSECFTFQPEGSFGTGSLSADSLNPFTIEVELGEGAHFVPGQTRVDVARGQGSIVSTLGKRAGPGDGAVLQTGTPEITSITFSSIPQTLNGRGSAGGYLLVPSGGFKLEISWRDRDSGSVDQGSLKVGTTSNTFTSSGTCPPGTDIVPFLERSDQGSTGARLTPKGGTRLAEGDLILWATVRDAEGNLSPRGAIRIVCADMEDDLRPFETTANSSQVWFIDTSRDRQAITISGTNTITVSVENTPNGIPDFREDLLAFGLRSGNPKFTDLGNGTGPNEFLEEKVKESMVSRLRELFSGVNITFTFDSPGTFPSAFQVPYNSFPFSRIAVGGASEVGALGLGIMDERNSNQDDDCAWPGTHSSLSYSLGVFPTELMEFLVNTAPTTLFRTTYDPLIPAPDSTSGPPPARSISIRNLPSSGKCWN